MSESSNTPDITLSELKKQKKSTETRLVEAIRREVADFEKQTGVSVRDIRVDVLNLDVSEIGEPENKEVTSVRSVILELPPI